MVIPWLQLSRIYGGISTRHASVIYVSPVFLPEEVASEPTTHHPPPT